MMACFHRSGRAGSLWVFGALLAVWAWAAGSSASVGLGDLALIGYRSDDPDALAFVVLSPIAAGEVIRFTDSGWQTSGLFRANEGGIQFTPVTALTPGTVLSRTAPFDTDGWSVNNAGLGSGGFLLSTAGDQILVFQGNAAAPTFIYALNADSAGWSNATSSNDTALPPGLTDGTTAVHIGSPERDNGYYNGPTQGTVAELHAAIGNPSNWVTSDDPQTWPSWTFTVQGDMPAITGVQVSGSAFQVDDPAVVTVQLDRAPSAGSPATVQVVSGAFATSPITIVINNPDPGGSSNVTMAHEGNWTADATAVSGCTGSATSAAFSVGAAPAAPVAYAGEDRVVILSSSSVNELMLGATADDPDGLAGVTYAWTPATGTGIVSWTSRTGPVNATIDPGEAQVTLSQTGVYIFTLTVTDPGMLMGQDSVTLTVINSGPIDDYDPPVSYYDPARPGGAWYTGQTLKSALRGIIDNHVVRSYDAARTALQLLDEDPNNPNNLILIYTGVSVPKPWDAGVTWNREHLWPDSLNPSGTNDSDLFHLRPCNPSVNSARGNKPFGLGSGYWDPNQGAVDRGDCARTMFYMATRYVELTLVNGLPGSNQMGDLAMLLVWHYEDPVNEGERRRNHLLYNSADNPSYYQGNRNPFVDHPELVWNIWGGLTNDSKLYVGDTAPPDGASSVTVDLGAVIVGGSLPPPQTVLLHKLGANPTTYEVFASGEAVSPSTGPRQAFVGGPATRDIHVGLSSSTALPGVKSGTLLIDNTEVVSFGTGTGSLDGDDTIQIQAEVLDHSEASFAAAVDQDALTLDFGTLPAGSGIHTQAFAVYNLVSASGYTAGLDLDAVGGGGATAILYTNLTSFSNLAAGGSRPFMASLDTSPGAGIHQAVYTLTVSDEDLSGAQPGTSLVLTLQGTVTAGPIFPFDDDGDGDVDLADFVGFSACLTGPGGGLAAPACVNHDAEQDGDVDLEDFRRFETALAN